VDVTVIVVGAGLAGLAAAWEIKRAGVDVIVLEAEWRPGGVIVTERRDGFVVEGGPDGFLAAEPEIPELARELGLADRLVDQLAKGSQLWTGQRLEPLAGGGSGGSGGSGAGRAAQLLGIQIASEGDLERGFRSLGGGMVEVVEALVGRLGSAVRVNQGVTGLTPSSRGTGWRLAVTGGSVQEAEAVVLAVPGWVAARFLAGAGVAAGRELGEVAYHPSITVSLAYRAEQVPAQLAGTGFVSAWESGAAVRACSYSWLKYPHRAPRGYALLRAFVGPVEGDGDAGVAAHAELARILGIQGEPLWTRAFHWPRGLPRYQPGHAERVAGIRGRLARLAPIDVAGAAVDGAGVSACVRSGREAARRTLERIGAH